LGLIAANVKLTIENNADPVMPQHNKKVWKRERSVVKVMVFCCFIYNPARQKRAEIKNLAAIMALYAKSP